MRIILASRNEGKLRELQALLADLPVSLESQAEHNVPSADETGATFIENAIIKARAVANATGLAALADDSGLVVPALNGAPGIYSARYAGKHGDDAANNSKLVSDLQGIEDRRAYFYCAMALLQKTRPPSSSLPPGTERLSMKPLATMASAMTPTFTSQTTVKRLLNYPLPSRIRSAIEGRRPLS